MTRFIIGTEAEHEQKIELVQNKRPELILILWVKTGQA